MLIRPENVRDRESVHAINVAAFESPAEAGLEQCRQQGFAAVVVLGRPEYYPRFGFLSSSRFGIDSEYEVPEDVFMAKELRPGVLSGKAGTVKYQAEFGNI